MSQIYNVHFESLQLGLIISNVSHREITVLIELTLNMHVCCQQRYQDEIHHHEFQRLLHTRNYLSKQLYFFRYSNTGIKVFVKALLIFLEVSISSLIFYL